MPRKRPRTPPRRDPHRPGAIVPADYEYVFSYNGATSMDGWPIPSFRINCELDRRTEKKTEDGKTRIINGKHDPDGRCCVIGLLNIARVKMASGTGQCSICGTFFVYGDVWCHRPTGVHVHVGHQCANKYSMIADRSEWELENGRRREAAAKNILQQLKKEDREAFLAAHPGLGDDLELDHPILFDLRSQFMRNAELSPEQVQLAQKLAAEIRDPSLREKHVPAPSGRCSFQGELVSVKLDVSEAYGVQFKCTVKVQTPDGSWLAWGTCPSAIVDRAFPQSRTQVLRHASDSQIRHYLRSLRGAKVEIRATLKTGREPHFAIMGRPTGVVLALAGEEAA